MTATEHPTDEGDPTAREIGAEIRAARRRLGLSTREFASRIDTSQPFVSNVENGRIFPSLRTLAVIAKALDVSANQLLSRSERVECMEATVGMRPRRDDEAPARRLFGAGTALINAYRVELQTGEYEKRPHLHEGEDSVTVLSGSVQLLREGLPTIILIAGESLHIVGTIPHRLAGGEEGGVALLVSTEHTQHGESPV